MSKSTSRFRKFFSYYKPYLGLFIADISCAFASAVISLVIPLMIRNITQNAMAGGGTIQNGIYITGAAMFILIIIQMFCTYFYDAKGHAMGAMMEHDMRRELFAHYQRLPFSFHDHQRPGQLMARITNDLLQLTELYHHGPEDLMIYLLKAVGAFLIILSINARLALVAFCFIPVMILYTVFFNKKLRRAYKVNFQKIGDVNARVEENLSGIRVVQSFTNEALEEAKFKKESNLFLQSRKLIYKNESYLYTGTETLARLVTVAVVVTGGILITGSSLDAADLITFLLYVGYMTEPIPQLIRITQQYQEGITGFNRYMDIIETAPDIRDKPGAVEINDVKGDVAFSGVGFRYAEDGEHVLKNISLRARAGECVALVGSSGVGKTTLCSLIPRFYDVSEGCVTLDGIDVRDITLNSLRAHIGVVHQDVYLFSGSVRENIRYGNPGCGDDAVIDAAKKAGAHEFITNLPHGYDTDIGHRGVRLSGGEKQRLSIARVFLKQPPILILDEATSALDSQSERDIQDALSILAKNRTTFIIAHRLSTIRGANRIIVLSDCGIEEQGTHDELMALNKAYARFYKIQAGSAASR
ncbi:MAG: ABC transporter ATP-binding protein/permease [Oscillospiraceae bacterium]|jgi:ATP-binding cassette subfamily B protein|nr:ABC transporter ATP-binding protein/permease [Oscillospiraceae bacterium]